MRKITAGLLSIVILLTTAAMGAQADAVSSGFQSAWRAASDLPVIVSKSGKFTSRGVITRIGLQPLSADPSGLILTFDQYTNFKAPKQRVIGNPQDYDLSTTFFYRITWPRGSTWRYTYSYATMLSPHETIYDGGDTGNQFMGAAEWANAGYIAPGLATMQFVEFWYDFAGKATARVAPVMRGETFFRVQTQGIEAAKDTVSVGVVELGKDDQIYGSIFNAGVTAYARVADSAGVPTDITGYIQRHTNKGWITELDQPVNIPDNSLVAFVPFKIFTPGYYRVAFVSQSILIGMAQFSVLGHETSGGLPVFASM